ncbi:MAG: NADH-quinone oxidoreductase subunit A [Deltaproteobacteria bacterium]
MGTDIGKILLWPPVAFMIVLAAAFLLSALCSTLSLRPGKHFKGEREPYACGEEGYNGTARPDYAAFFPFAIFFTIAHVAALMMATVPFANARTTVLAVLFITGVIAGLYILMRKE